MDTIDFQGISGRRRRRLHSDEFKADAIAAAAQPGVSMASVAMARGINANLLRRWVRDAEVAPTKALPKPAPTPSTFVPVQLPAPAAPVGDIRLELRRGTTTISVTWPMAAAAECAGCETPVGMLKPGNKKTHKAYIWTYCTTTFNPTKAVVFNFAETRSGENVREFLGQNGERPWKGKLVTDGFSGYKATFERGVTSVGCVAHARPKFHELWASHGSKVGEQALRYFQLLFEIEEDIACRTPDERRRIRQRKSRRVAAALNKWLLRQRLLVPDGSA